MRGWGAALSQAERPGVSWIDPPRLAAAAIIVVGALASLWLNWPGHLSYDSVVQLAEGRTGLYSGEHPPVMSWLLGLADAAKPGASLFVVLDTLLIAGALLALVLMAGRGSWLAPPLALVCVFLPQLVLYPAIVWKDVLFAGSSAGGFACLAWAAEGWTRRALRYGLLGAGLCLLALAALTRQNGAVVLPFAAIAVGWIALRRSDARRLGRAVATGLGFLAASVALFVTATALLSTRLETSDPDADAWTALQTYDVVGAAVRSPRLDLAVLRTRDPGLGTLIRTTGVSHYSPSRVDSIQHVLDRMDADGADDAPIAAQWRELIARHPWLYLRVRASAFRWVFMTPDAEGCVMVYTGVDGPAEEMGQAGLKRRRTDRDDALGDYAMAFARTPAYSHAAYAAVGLGLLILLLRRRRPADIAVAAMLGAAFAFAASFALISIACDYRYLYDLDLAVIAAALYAAAGFSVPAPARLTSLAAPSPPGHRKSPQITVPRREGNRSLAGLGLPSVMFHVKHSISRTPSLTAATTGPALEGAPRRAPGRASVLPNDVKDHGRKFFGVTMKRASESRSSGNATQPRRSSAVEAISRRPFSSQPQVITAAAEPASCARMNCGADDGAMPANVLDRLRATVTAGLAKEVEAVNQ